MINCAHRGASAYAPENTLAALHLALKMGATMAEIDLQQTADNELVLFHDDELDRTSNGRGFLWQKTLDHLSGLDAGSWFSNKFAGESIPTLESIIKDLDGKMALNIELKLHGHEREIEKLMAEKLNQLNLVEVCLVTSFDHEVIDRLLALVPNLKAGYIVGREQARAQDNSWQKDLLSSPVAVLSMEKTLISQELVQKAHAENKEIHAWTVNNEDEMKRLQAAGVDALISNYPDKVNNFINKSRI